MVRSWLLLRETAVGRASTLYLQAPTSWCQLRRTSGLRALSDAGRTRSGEDASDLNVGVLTGGGDCPGLNAVIRAVARRSFARGHDVVGVRAGWRGLVDGTFEQLGPREVSGLLPRGGTVLGTSRTNTYRLDGGVEAVLANFQSGGLDALGAV